MAGQTSHTSRNGDIARNSRSVYNGRNSVTAASVGVVPTTAMAVVSATAAKVALLKSKSEKALVAMTTP
jgi:hypothetical protein